MVGSTEWKVHPWCTTQTGSLAWKTGHAFEMRAKHHPTATATIEETLWTCRRTTRFQGRKYRNWWSPSNCWKKVRKEETGVVGTYCVRYEGLEGIILWLPPPPLHFSVPHPLMRKRRRGWQSHTGSERLCSSAGQSGGRRRAPLPRRRSAEGRAS